MRTGMISLIFAFIILGIPSAHPSSSREKSEQSLDLLEVQMKLQALQTLTSRGYYISPNRLEIYRREQEKLSQAFGMGSGKDLSGINNWVKESAKTKKAEKSLMVELAKSWGRKIIAKAADKEGVLANLKNWKLKLKEMELDRKKNASWLAGEVEKLAKQYHYQKTPEGGKMRPASSTGEQFETRTTSFGASWSWTKREWPLNPRGRRSPR